MEKEPIEIYWDSEGRREGIKGCFQARLARNHGIHDAGRTRREAIINLVALASSFGYSNDPESYEAKYLNPSERE